MTRVGSVHVVSRWAAWTLAVIGFGYPGTTAAQARVNPAARSPAKPLIVQVATDSAGSSDRITVTIDSGVVAPVGPDGSVRFGELAAGPHMVRLSGLREGCTAAPNPRIVLLGRGVEPQTETFRVACPEPPGEIAVPDPVAPPPPPPPSSPPPPPPALPVARIRPSSVDDSTTLIRISALPTGADLDGDWRATLEAVSDLSPDSAVTLQILLDTLFEPSSELHDDRIVRPESTTRYVFTVTGPTGEATAETTVVVRTRVETVMRVDTIRLEGDTVSSQGADWWWGPGIGSAGVITGPASVIVPFVASVSAGWSDNWTVTLRGGLSPADSPGADPVSPGDPRPAFHSRTLKMVSLGVTVFPTGRWWGGALSYVGAWEMVRGLDYYTKRAYGPAVGPRGRWDFRPWDLVRLRLSGGVDLQYAHVSAYDEPVPEWTFGVTVPVALTLVLD